MVNIHKKIKILTFMPLLNLKNISSHKDFYIFKFQPTSIKFGLCSIRMLTIFIKDFLSKLGSDYCDFRVKKYIPFKMDGKYVILNMTLINIKDLTSLHNLSNIKKDIVVKNIHYTFNRYRDDDLSKLIVKHLNKNNHIQLDKTEFVLPKVITVLIPKGSKDERYFRAKGELILYVPTGKTKKGFLFGEAEMYVIDKQSGKILRKLYP
uniref:Uncharacterized protein n=1 Tax=Fomitiporia mediterranea TaxID=208960 RepID=A0A5B9R9M8_9AGAM|nr:hypothetical protein Fomme_000055 [Fomitiporia mediterranea]QEG57052.1 hypothetical protein Fomme_000055 [Fomitiporia mediterranea]